MAQLVDGRGDQFAEEYSSMFHDGAVELRAHPDWDKLSQLDQQFTWNCFAFLLFQSASGFDRRVMSQLKSFPICLLAMAKIRHDLPDQERKTLSRELIKSIKAGTADIQSSKLFRAFKADFEEAATSGKYGAGLYTTLKAMRYMWKADVRENERLNKQMQLFGNRCPNASLDLCTARLGLKYCLGRAGLRQEELDYSKSRNWSRTRPLASIVMDTCLNNWIDAGEVLSDATRFQETTPPSWCPTKELLSSWNSWMLYRLKST